MTAPAVGVWGEHSSFVRREPIRIVGQIAPRI
jgi:hypothetical protein